MGNMGEGMIGNKMIIPEEFKHIVDHICNYDLEMAISLLEKKKDIYGRHNTKIHKED